MSHDILDTAYYLEIFDFDEGELRPSLIDPDSKYLCLVYAPWCGPCRAFLPVIEKISKEYGKNLSSYNNFTNPNPNKVKIVLIKNVSKDDQDSKTNPHFQDMLELSDNVKKIIPDFKGFPTLVMFKGGKLVSTFKGSRDYESVKKWIDSN